MTNLEDKEFELLLTPPKGGDYSTRKPWIIGMWLSPQTEPETIETRFNLIPYHWGDRIKLESDVESIKKYIESVKKVLYPALNEVHKSDYSARYWDVLVGEWLYLYTQVMYDRWSVVSSVFNLDKGDELLDRRYSLNEIPYDTNGFLDAAISDHNWNANLLVYIAHRKSEKMQIDSREGLVIAKPIECSPPRFSYKKMIVSVLSKLYIWLYPKRKGVIVQSPYLDDLNFIKLCLCVKGLMYIKSGKIFIPLEHPSARLRDELSKQLKIENQRDSTLDFLISTIVNYLPSIYLEHYFDHKEFSQKQYFDYFPRLIVTANSHYSDETWKSWAASARERGTRIVVLQHGGHYGHSKFSLMQDYEIEVADKFLSWGWTDLNNNKVIVAPANKLIGLRITRKSKISCLVVTFESSTYAYWLASIPIGPQVINSKEMTMGFLREVKNPVRSSVRVRTYPVDYGLDQRNFFQSSFPDLSFSSSHCDFKSDLRDVRIVVFNYFSTTFIEAVKMGIPSVVFINPAHWEVQDSFTSLFSSLVDIGVLHHSSNSCAQFVEKIWDSVDAWWSNSDTTQVIDEFIRLFGYTGANPIRDLSQTILKV